MRRGPVRFAAVTALIIALNVIVFFQELVHGQAFVWTWSVIPIRIMHGHAWITLLTSMFMHAGWMHIIGNMVTYGPLDARLSRQWVRFDSSSSIFVEESWLWWRRSSATPSLKSLLSEPAAPSLPSWEHFS